SPQNCGARARRLAGARVPRSDLEFVCGAHSAVVELHSRQNIPATSFSVPTECRAEQGRDYLGTSGEAALQNPAWGGKAPSWGCSGAPPASSTRTWALRIATSTVARAWRPTRPKNGPERAP